MAACYVLRNQICVWRSSVLQQAAAALQGPKEDVKKE